MPENSLYKNAPQTPGVYLMKNGSGEVLYVGKAANLRRRVSSYFQRPQDYRLQRMVSEVRDIEFKKTDTAIEALLLESELIKKISPPYNVREKDNKSFLCVEITKDSFPRVLLVRAKDAAQGERFGPFTSATSIRETLRIIRKIFPWSTHAPDTIGTYKRPCFDYEIGLCPGTCIGVADRKEYLRNIQNIRLLFSGKKKKILSNLEKEMRMASKALEFEKAERRRQQLFALQHIQDVAVITEEEPNMVDAKTFRIEGYDISNISGTSAVGSMVVFTNGKSDKAEYRKFRIKTVLGADDYAMMKEVIERRFNNPWQFPDLILIDGGLGQVNAARSVLKELHLNIPVIGMVKGPERKRTDIIGTVPEGADEKTLVRVRDEAHRFAISYHRSVRSKNSGITRRAIKKNL